MKFFWQKASKPETDVVEDVLRLQKGLKTLEIRVFGLEMEAEAFRNKVLRKVQKARGAPEAGEDEENKPFYSGVLISEKE